jgi:hypothetical protein
MIPDTKYVNPLDNLFDVDPAGPNEMTEYEQITEGEIAELAAPATGTAPEKDAEDVEVDKKIDAVYDAALETFQNQMAYTEIIEPRYAARNAEVAASYLNIALQAAATRARVKGDRKRVGTFIPNGGRVTNNTIVATRDEIMRMIAIDAEHKEV